MAKTSQRAKNLQKIYLANKDKPDLKPWDTCTLRERLMHQSWCFKNNIFIYFQPDTWREGRIVIINNGEKSVSAQVYNQIKLKPNDTRYWEIIFKLYSKFYYEANENRKSF